MSGDQGTTQSTAEEAREPRIGGLPYAPLFRIDPGWPFVIAGLALIVSAVLIPAQRELHDLEQQLKVHRAYEEKAKAELLAYEQFIADVHKGDPRLLERLVRAQLNKMPKDERPLLLMPTANDTVPQWIESSVTVEIPEPQPYADTLLARIASGPRRLWVLASGTFLVFMGILFVPSTGARRPVRRAMPVSADTVPADTVPVANGAAVAVVTPEFVPELASGLSSELEPGHSNPAESTLGERTSAVGDEVEPVPSADTADAFLASEPLSADPAPEEVSDGQAEAVSVAVSVPVTAEEPIRGAFEEPVPVVDETCVEEGAMVEPETLDSAVAEVETFAAQDVHQLQYGGAEQVEEIHAATDSLPSEVETEVRAEADEDAGAPACVIETFAVAAPSVPAATDRALDGMSLFSGIDDARWIDPRDPRG